MYTFLSGCRCFSSRLVSMDSFFAGEMNPHVLTMRTSASPGSAARRQPAPTSAAIIRSESTWFFAQPRLSTWNARPGPGLPGPCSVEGRDLEDIPAGCRVAPPGDPARCHLSEITKLEILSLDAQPGSPRIGEPDRRLLPGRVDGELLALL